MQVMCSSWKDLTLFCDDAGVILLIGFSCHKRGYASRSITCLDIGGEYAYIYSPNDEMPPMLPGVIYCP